ncbi:MAG TPA: M28 family peptidase, partial [Gemmatimonadaceae bacterium]|nr:M28 family peptidase [Gemmatimonadaceae bacterium]
MRRVVVLSVFLGACAPAAPTVSTGTSPARVVAVDELRRDVYAFAADSFLGRETGTPSATRAARFIADRLMSLGVEPAGDSLFYQRVPLVKNSFGNGTRFTVTTADGTSALALGAEITPMTNLGAGAPLPKRNAEGDVVFAGYGMMTHGRNDFAGINEAGKVIVMLHGAPANVTDTAARSALESQDELGQRLVRALQLQPSAIILLMTGGTEEFYSQATPDLLRSVAQAPGDQSTSDAQRPLPMVLLGVAKAGSSLLPANWPASDAPQALAGRRFSGRVELRSESFTGYNMVAVVRGTDPRFNKTYVAYGSHYDHIGILSGTPGDSIANGADDDASGSMTMLAIAR